MKYRIGLTQTVYEGTTVTVVADSPKEAEERALEIVNNGDNDLGWEYLTTTGTVVVVSIDQIKE